MPLRKLGKDFGLRALRKRPSLGGGRYTHPKFFFACGALVVWYALRACAGATRRRYMYGGDEDMSWILLDKEAGAGEAGPSGSQ